MNKRLMTLSMAGLLTMTLASCSDVKEKTVDGKQVIVTVGGTEYTADDLLAKYGAAVKIGIQTLPGIKFYISDSNLSNGIIIDHTGVYELDLRNTTTAISNLRFDAASLSRIDEVDNASLIVDVLCNSTNDEAVN